MPNKFFTTEELFNQADSFFTNFSLNIYCPYLKTFRQFSHSVLAVTSLVKNIDLFLDWYKWKTYVSDKIYVTEILEFVLGRVEYMVTSIISLFLNVLKKFFFSSESGFSNKELSILVFVVFDVVLFAGF